MFSKTWMVDTVERVAATFVESAVGIWILAGPANVFSLSTAHGAAAAGLIAALVVVKSAIASTVGDKDSASLVPTVPAPVVKAV